MFAGDLNFKEEDPEEFLCENEMLKQGIVYRGSTGHWENLQNDIGSTKFKKEGIDVVIGLIESISARRR
jgi:hypothetical protein